MNIFVTLMVVFSSLLLSGCSFRKEAEIVNNEVSVSPSVSIEENEYVATDPIELFLVELTKATKIPFSNPVKSDSNWKEGYSVSTLKTFFADDAFLINNPNPKADDEQTVEKYFKDNGFEYMKFNESRGEDSHKVGYRKENLICKYDKSKYPDEDTAHLLVYCADASTGKEN